jgi:hypothetical protein
LTTKLAGTWGPIKFCEALDRQRSLRVKWDILQVSYLFHPQGIDQQQSFDLVIWKHLRDMMLECSELLRRPKTIIQCLAFRLIYNNPHSSIIAAQGLLEVAQGPILQDGWAKRMHWKALFDSFCG